MKPAVLFDLGNTLAAYYHSEQFRPLLEAAIRDLATELRSLDLSRIPFDTALASALAANKEAPDHRFTPMADRFERIFQVSLADNSQLARRLCEVFLRPIFDIGHVYDDSLPVLERLRSAGHPLAIVSNAPWGSPPSLWRDELKRLGLASAVDTIVLCGDVGWRKPAPEIFRSAASKLDRRPEDCIFVGDDLRWDVSGSQAVGMKPVLIDRDQRNQEYDGFRIKGLDGLVAIVESRA